MFNKYELNSTDICLFSLQVSTHWISLWTNMLLMKVHYGSVWARKRSASMCNLDLMVQRDVRHRQHSRYAAHSGSDDARTSTVRKYTANLVVVEHMLLKYRADMIQGDQARCERTYQFRCCCNAVRKWSSLFKNTLGT